MPRGEVIELIAAHKLTIVFVNTRAVAELIFRDLWAENDAALPIGIHHGSLSPEARRKVESAMATGRLRAIVATASLDLGIDWGDVDLVVQMGAPKGSSRLLQRIGRANHRMDEASEAVVVPGNRFEYLESLAARDAVAAHELDVDTFRPGGRRRARAARHGVRLRRAVRRRRPLCRGADQRALCRAAARRVRPLPRLHRVGRLRAQGL